MDNSNDEDRVWGYGASALPAQNYSVEKGSELAKEWETQRERNVKEKKKKQKPPPKMSGVDCMSAFLRLKEETQTVGTDVMHGNFINLPVSVLFIGRSMASRKSTAFCNMLINPHFFGGAFKGEDIFLISPTARMDPKYKMLTEYLDIPPENLITEVSESVFEYIYSYIEEDKLRRAEEGLEPRQYCVGIDDVGYDKLVHESGSVTKLFSNGRHVNISPFAMMQSITMLQPHARKNARVIVYFDMVYAERDKAQEQFGYWDKPTYRRLLQTCTKIKGQCLLQTIPTRGENKMYWGVGCKFYDVTPRAEDYKTPGQFDRLEEAERLVRQDIEFLRKQGIWTEQDDAWAGIDNERASELDQTQNTELTGSDLREEAAKRHRERKTAKRKKKDKEEMEREVFARLEKRAHREEEEALETYN